MSWLLSEAYFTVILNVNQSLEGLNAILNPPQISIKSFYLITSHQFDMSYPYCYLVGASFSCVAFVDALTMKYTTNNQG
jgi:hypothetical protein